MGLNAQFILIIFYQDIISRSNNSPTNNTGMLYDDTGSGKCHGMIYNIHTLYSKLNP